VIAANVRLKSLRITPLGSLFRTDVIGLRLSGDPKLSQGPYKEFPVDQLVDNSITDFDLFLPVKDHFILYSSAGYHWLKEELDSLLRNGYRNFSIREADDQKASIYRRVSTLPLIDKNQAPRERISSIEQIGSGFIKCLYEGDITQACVEKAKHIASSTVACIAEDRSCIQLLGALAEHDHYTYTHSIRVSAFTIAICIEMGMTDQTKLSEIALGGIFHDVGKRFVPLDVINKVGSLSEREWRDMRSHPEQGFFSVKDTILSHVPREIILHHHEKLDGSGYPHGIDRNSLLYEVQIATLADVFDALTSNRAYQVKRSHFEALEFIKSKMVGAKLPLEPFKALISCLSRPLDSENAA
jgi:HD-GYP domain-containing protein (c-di-GMP phosphodiesterase class II)